MPERSSATFTEQVHEPVMRAPANDNSACPSSEYECAVAVVNELLSFAGLAKMIEAQSLSVIVGDGNWISFSFQMQRGADHSSLDLSTTLRRISGKAQQGKSRKSAWFRSEGLPSLHFEVIPAERLGEIFVRGHVDAADPKRHPVVHLFRDYLPAHGVGTHPAPKELLAMINPRLK